MAAMCWSALAMAEKHTFIFKSFGDCDRDI
jgi:hypothetical protein